ncbi:hypothetical protein [Bacillus sp. NRRL B-14911]|uniref:hypothetical protein n=1 Tax=Bacillus sp. NRRL B-14911 TaxID=313627 RepID=UPI000556BF9F|nr:hypothetical protein [Bacillus sp. NRRL B-14911]
MPFKSKFLVCICLLHSTLYLTACMSSHIEEEIQKTETEKSASHDQAKEKESSQDKVELSPEQKKSLEALENKDLEESLFENDLDLRKELDKNVPDAKPAFTDPEEFSQYISYVFFAYYKGDMKPEEFANQFLKYAHPEYIEQLPNNRENQIETFKVLQETYLDQLHSSIKDYVITDIDYQGRVGEAAFYRKFILENGEEMYSITILKQQEDKTWRLLEDSPAPPYEVAPLMEKQQNKAEER